MGISNPNLSQITAELSKLLPKLKPMSSVPPGMIGAFNSVPEGWLRCNGAAVSRTTYAALFAVIGTKYGSGDGSTTFNLPNLHHRFIEATTSDSEIGDRVSEGLPNITGDFFGNRDGGTSYGFGSSGTTSGAFYNAGSSGYTAYAAGNARDRGSIGFRASYSDSSYGSSSYVQPSSLRLVHCIKF